LPWPIPASYARPGGYPTGPWIWPSRREGVKQRRPTRLQRPYVKRFTGMLPKRKGTPGRHSRFPPAGMSNMPPLLPWHLQAIDLDRKRSPVISTSVSPRIPSPNLPTYRYFARYPLFTRAGLRKVWSGRYRGGCRNDRHRVVRGTCLGPYRIESKLGEGGMGVVSAPWTRGSAARSRSRSARRGSVRDSIGRRGRSPR
jgi:hypothetical protein